MNYNVEEIVRFLEQYELPILPLNGKIPANNNGSKGATQDYSILDGYQNYGIRAGDEYEDGYLTIIDVDINHNGMKSWMDYITKNEIDTETLTVKTGTGGFHFYYFTPTQIHNSASQLGEGIDVRGMNGYVVGPGSLHPDTHRVYEIQNDEQIKKMPEKLYEDILALKAKKNSTSIVDKRDLITKKIGEGERNDHLFRYGVAKKKSGAASNERELKALLMAENDAVCEPPVNEAEIETLLKSLRDNVSQSTLAPELEDYVNQLEEEWSVIKFGSKTLYIDSKFPETKGLDYKNFFEWVKNYHVLNDKGKPEFAAPIWTMQTEKRYNGLCFNPVETPTGYFNMWRGSEFEPAEAGGKAQIFLDFVKEVICSNDEVSYDFMIKLLAHMAQYPQTKEGVAVALRGIQGTGKTFFVDTIGKLWSKMYYKVDSADGLRNNFNSHLANKFIVFADDIVSFWGGKNGHEIKAMLKNLITSRTFNMTQKGKDTVQLENYLRLFMATNGDWAAPSEKNDRRWFVLDVAKTHRQDRNYFGMMQNALDDGGYEELYGYLLSYEIAEEWDYDIPETDAKIEQVIDGMEPFERFWYNELNDEYKSNYTVEDIQMQVEEEYHQSLSREKVGKLMSKIFNLEKKRIRIAGIRQSVYEMPDIEEAKKMLNEYVGFALLYENNKKEELGQVIDFRV